MKLKSSFDTGNWSKVSGLPNEQDMTNFLEHLTASDPNECYTRLDLYDAIATEFEIPALVQEATGPNSTTPAFHTSVSRGVLSHALYGIRHADGNRFLKRVALATYQHITGNLPAFYLDQNGFRSVLEAMVSVKLLRSINWDAERIYTALAGRKLCGWTDDEIQMAVDEVFNFPAPEIK
jgi:hypothetical protein